MCLAQQQYKQSDEAKAKNASYDSLNDRYKRWTSEDLDRTGEMDRINQQVSQREAEFNQAKEQQLRKYGWRPESELAQQSSTGPNLRLGTMGGRPGPNGQQQFNARGVQGVINMNPTIQGIQRQQFNSDKMRQDLTRQAALKRVESGVYQRPNITADTPTTQAAVIGGASSRVAKGSTSGGTRGGTGTPRNGPTGVKLNIGT
jgi:hypothetical protein